MDRKYAILGLFLAASVLLAILFSPFASLGDREGYRKSREIMEGRNNTIYPPFEEINITIDASKLAEREIVFSQVREALSFPLAFRYNSLAIRPFYECVDISHGFQENFICPDNFRSLSHTIKTEVELAMRRTPESGTTDPTGAHLPLTYLNLNGVANANISKFSFSGRPSERELFEIAKKPMRLFDEQGSRREISFLASFRKTDSPFLCIETGIPYQRSVRLSVTGPGNIIKYTLPDWMSHTKEGSAYVFSGTDNNSTNFEIFPAEICFSGEGGA